MSQLRSDYQVYLQDLFEKNLRYLYDEDGHVVSVQSIHNIKSLSYIDWLNTEMQEAIDIEDYRYAAKIRDEILYLQLYTVEEYERYIA